MSPCCALQEQEEINAEDEEEDSFSDKEEDLGAVEEERSVILHLLSQLKLGMDLTRVGRVPRRAEQMSVLAFTVGLQGFHVTFT